MSAKQDRTAARTPADLERKYNFDQSFAEIMGIATDARTTAEAAKATAENATKLTPEEVFNLLTNNGALQGLYRGEDGQIYFNASYIMSGIIDAAVVKVVNLIAETVISKDTTGGTMEILGGIFRLYQDKNVLLEATTEYEGYPVFRMTLLDNGEIATRLEMGADGIQVVDLTGAVPKVKFAFVLDEDGDPAITCKDSSGNVVTKKIIWRSNVGGTYTLTGE
jgi:hypothetical protein